MSIRSLLLGFGLVFALALAPAFADGNGDDDRLTPDRSVEPENGDDAEDGDDSAEELPRGADSPEAAFETFKDSFKNKDYAKTLSVLTEQAGASLTFMMVGIGVMIMTFAEFNDDPEVTAHARKFAEILERHGIDAEELEELEDEEAAVERYREIDNPAGLLGDVFKWFEEMPGQDSSMNDAIGAATLQNLEIDGDEATGEIVDADGNASPMAFVRTDGRWYISDLAG